MNKKIAIVLALAGTLAVSGTLIAKNGIRVTANGTQNSLNLRPDKITKEQARKIALERVPGEIVDEEYEKEDGKMVYGFEIKQADGTVMEVKIDEMTGTIIFAGKDDGDGEDEDDSMDTEDNDSINTGESVQSEAELMKQAKITRTRPEKTALKKVKGTIEEGELEMENGKLVYSFDIRNKKGTITEVQVDAKTGKIVSVEEEDAEKEAAEKAMDKKEKP